ncbi:MAG: hypothetical protein OEZ13_07550 [Spirochaetia bacterium]|nr:hypothetical protein [Spirochaetia bacterium]
MRGRKFITTLCIVLFSLLSCKTIYYSHGMQQKENNWEFNIESIEKGPKSFIIGRLEYYPEENHTYITTKISIKNLSSTESNLDLRKMFLVSDNIVSSPQFISMKKIILLPAPKVAKISPNEEIYRELIHVFPEKLVPKMLVIDTVTTIPIEQQDNI